MKAKKFTKKLVFKKLTVANLENIGVIKGGKITPKGLTRKICANLFLDSGCMSCGPCC